MPSVSHFGSDSEYPESADKRALSTNRRSLNTRLDLVRFGNHSSLLRKFLCLFSCFCCFYGCFFCLFIRLVSEHPSPLPPDFVACPSPLFRKPWPAAPRSMERTDFWDLHRRLGECYSAQAPSKRTRRTPSNSTRVCFGRTTLWACPPDFYTFFFLGGGDFGIGCWWVSRDTILG